MAGGEQLQGRIEQVAATIDGLDRRIDEDGVHYAIDGVPFSVVSGNRASFRLRPDVADAALKTPDVHAGRQGPGWVELETTEADQFALDRASSWFAAGARFASETPRRRAH